MDHEYAIALNQAVRLLSLRHRARAAELLAPLGLHPGQEALLLELARSGPMIQGRLSEALGIEPPSVTLMTRKLEAAGHVRRAPDPSDRRASVVELTDSGEELAGRIGDAWQVLAEETAGGVPAEAAASLPALLTALADNVDSRQRRRARASGDDPDYEPSARGWVRKHVEQVMRSGTTDGVTIADRPTVLMTYRGAKTGKIRKTPLMRVEHEGRYVAVGSNGGTATDPQWCASVTAEGAVVSVQDGRVTREYRAREVFGDEKALWWDRAVDAFPDYAAYQRSTDRSIPVFVLDPIDLLDPVVEGRADRGRGVPASS
ncbi:nitroreductase/quinone reductase family protein [Yinghuangia sp. YIM S09857]|uniref:nitroreductase/quinone reductase family protein n=1 Tax=Yinghuangia sp. YIM S09857 TaxID=3436929 RepID=UPI003F533741